MIMNGMYWTWLRMMLINTDGNVDKNDTMISEWQTENVTTNQIIVHKYTHEKNNDSNHNNNAKKINFSQRHITW